MILLDRLEVRRYRKVLPLAVRNATNTWVERSGVVLTLVDRDGVRGVGEASPLPGYSRESEPEVWRCLETLAASRLPPLSESIDVASQVSAVLEAIDAGFPSARFALETAILDLLGKRLNRPVYALLTGAPVDRVPLSALASTDALGHGLVSARLAFARGVRTIKFKIGNVRGFGVDYTGLRQARRDLGAMLQIRLDANGDFNLQDAPGILEQLAELQPEFVEEPVPYSLLPRLKRPPVPVALDESLHGPGGLERAQHACERGWCQFIVLKPMALGGAFECLRIAEQARQCGVRCVASHMYDGPIAFAAAAALALALPGAAAAAGLDRHGLDPADRYLNVPSVTATHVVAAGHPGLGLHETTPESCY